MKRNRMLAVLAVVAVVAVSLIGYRWLETGAADDGPSVTQRANEYVLGWRNSGMYLPEPEECQFFARNFAETRTILAASLFHPRDEVRMRGAFVIDKLGDVAGSLSPDVIAALSAEEHELVRIYLINAARSVGQGDSVVLDSLRKMFRAPTNEKEQLYVAAALYVLTDDMDEQAAAEELMCAYLLPYESTGQEHSPEDYDDLRWSAVNSVEHMVGAARPIPLLEDMLSEEEAKRWVRVHVPRALKALRTAGRSVESQPAEE